MRFRLDIERLSDGHTIRLTQNERNYQLLEVDGLEIPEIDMASYDIASIDGITLSNIRVPDREITITLVIRGNVENNRKSLHQLCRVRSLMRLHFVTKGGSRYIDGYVKSITSNRFDDPSFTFVIVIDCPDPYFKDENHLILDLSRKYGTFVFPFGISATAKRPVGVVDPLRTATINSVSENETGIIIRVTFTDNANSLRITNADTGEVFVVNYPFLTNDIVEINTIDGQKDVTLTRNSQTSSIIAYVTDDSDFFQLQAGDNSFNFIIDDDVSKIGATMEFDFTPIYLTL